MKAGIINIGDELLIGQVINTNASWIADQLTTLGFEVEEITAIHDGATAINECIGRFMQKFDLTVMSGGLGPTSDDITKQVLCDYFRGKMVTDQKTLENIEHLFKSRDLEVTPLNRKQADIPDCCMPLLNETGTAPGMLFEKGKAVLIALPGVPFEMKNIFEKSLTPEIKKRFTTTPLIKRTIMTTGIPESYLAEKLEGWEKSIRLKGIMLAYLPQPGIIRLRLSKRGSDQDKIMQELEKEIENIRSIVPEHVFSYCEEGIERVIGNLLSEYQLTVSTAESCTGGNIAKMITSVPGSSAYYKGSIIAYHNEIKSGILSINPSIINEYGAVSKEVVELMASKVCKIIQSDVAVATSGIAGPGGGTENKKVGTTWIAIAYKSKIISKQFVFGDNRERNITRASIAALNMLRLAILNK